MLNTFSPLRRITKHFFVITLFLGTLILAACSHEGSRPDLARLYAQEKLPPQASPVIVIHGLAGSTLTDAKTGKQFWPGSLSTLAFSTYRELARMSSEDREGEGLVPGDLFYGIAGVDFYSALINSLETVGRFQRSTPGQPVGDQGRRYYVLLYDWRKDNIEAVKRLHAMIEQIRLDYHDPTLRVDIIAHSNGGLIANYYLRYGPTDVLEQPAFTPWHEGDLRVRRLVMLGTPNLGSVSSLQRLLYGLKIGFRTIPVEVLATFSTPFQALPHPLVQTIMDGKGNTVPIDIYNPAVWRDRQWSVFSPEVDARVRGSMPSPEAGEAALLTVQAAFDRNLHRALRLQLSLSTPLPTKKVQIAVFGGDCKLTQSRAVLMQDEFHSYLEFDPAKVSPRLAGEKGKHRPAVDFERLMLEPGDGLVTRSSQVANEIINLDEPRRELDYLPTTQSFFLCESHGRLTSNLYFQNNLLYFLLSR